MEYEKTIISVEIQGTERNLNSIKEIKQARKDLTEAALKGDKQAVKSLNELSEKFEEIKDRAQTVKGGGIEPLANSFGLLGEGIKTFDFDKIKTGFSGVGMAMKAIPIFLLVEGISYLVEHWKELSDGNGLIAKSLQFLEGIFEKVTDVIYAFTDAIGLTNTELDKQGEAIKSFAEKSNAALAEQSAGFDRQIAVAKAAGKSTVALEQAKQQAIIDTNFLIAKQIEAFVRAGGELDDEKRKQLTASLDLIKNAKVQEYVITETDNKAKQEQYKKHLEDIYKISKGRDAANKKLTEDRLKADKQSQSEQDKEDADLAAQRAKALDDLRNTRILNEKQDVADFIKNEEDKKKAEQARIDNGFALSKSTLDSTQALSDIFFAQKLNKAKKGSAEETAIAKKQFEVNKALQIAQATMQGAQAVLAAYASGSAIPVIGAVAGPLYAVAAGLVAIKNIQAIKNAQFGGGGSAPDTSASAVSLPSSNGTPNITPSTIPQQTTTFTGNKNDQYQPIKTFVTEGDIRHSSKRIDTLQSQATF